ncbi:MAG: magnesium transporter [Anaerolineales bacterium]|nr:magnesium transporter [Anaerolineales bacterium]
MQETGYIHLSIEEIETLLEQGKQEELRERLTHVHPADIADFLDELEGDQAVAVFSLLTIPIGSEVLDETGGIIRQELVEKVDDEMLADLLDELPMDDAAEFLEDLPEPVSDRLLGLMEPDEAADVQELLSYEEETAGRLMNRDVAALRRHWTVEETFTFLRSLEDAETLHYLYVVDAEDRLLGVVPLRILIMSQPNATIGEIMTQGVVSVTYTADQEELAEMVSRYDYFAIPVVDQQERLLGVVTHDDVLDILEEEVTEDIQRLGGSEPLDQPYFAVSPFRVVQKRIGWLLLLFVAAIMTAKVLQLFEESLTAVLALSFFIPLVTGTGGNAGSQTVATIIRAITLDEVRLSNLLSAWRREIVVAMTLGMVMGLCGFGVVTILTGDIQVAWVVAVTLPVVVMWAITIATVVPIIANHFKIDPTVISGPMITTIVDASALLVYFLLASLLLGI